MAGEDGLGGKQAERLALRAAFEERCWKIKTTHDSDFSTAFEGYRNSKPRFCDKLLAEYATNAATLRTMDDLRKRASTVFEKGLEKLTPLPPVSLANLVGLEASPVLAKKVVGKEDVDIAALIRRLGNSDWVKEGLGYLEIAGTVCPFCQQDAPHDLERRLNEYFDETYLTDVADIERVKDSYMTFAASALERLEVVATSGSRYLDALSLRAEIERLSDRIELNKRQLEKKHKEASSVVKLDTLAEISTAIEALINAANDEIGEHNRTVENLASEKSTLISEIWKCLLDESKDSLSEYTNAKSGFDKAISSINETISEKNIEIAAARARLTMHEKSITSVLPTVNEINSILASFGFTGFKLATAGEQANLYEIIRPDGTNAAKTLSEGERSFITFLYFYHLIRGSTSESGMTADRVIVFDDPVSSLDSDVLFIVSALIKRVLDEACRQDGLIKQVFVLTHNIYFHKEVSFDPRRSKECRAHETFWIVRKVGAQSVVVGYDHNPIKTSYELLWSEVKNPQRSNSTIQNTLRRILENYFKILGNLDKDDIVAKFEGRDQQICGSLFSWVNDGSHSAHDDLYISADDAMVERYLGVFARIFQKTGHEAHYDMMMGGPAPEPQLEPADGA